MIADIILTHTNTMVINPEMTHKQSGWKNPKYS